MENRIASKQSSPFGAMAAGDLIHPVAFDAHVSAGTTIEIARVEHLVWDKGEGLRHKICVYTTAE